MTVKKEEKAVPFDLMGDLMPAPVKAKKEEKERKSQWDYNTEIPDFEDGFIYEKKRGDKKGKQLRKLFENLYGGYREEGITFWRPKLKDLAACEASRWHSVQYSNNQMKMYEGFFESVVREAPLRYIRLCDEWPGFEWYHIEKHQSCYASKYEYGISEGRIRETDKEMAFPIKQDVGDAYRRYSDRCKTVRERCYYFQHLFSRSLNERYSQDFYNYKFRMLKLVINEREYIIGESSRDGSKFGVIAYPEEIRTEIV